MPIIASQLRIQIRARMQNLSKRISINTRTAILCVAALFGATSTGVHAKEIGCTQTHSGGNKEQIRVNFNRDGQIQGFLWWYASPDRNTFCTIGADSFLSDTKGNYQGRSGCELMVWQQGRRMTFALSPQTPGCASYCSSQQALERLLPIAMRKDGGGCSD